MEKPLLGIVGKEKRALFGRSHHRKIVQMCPSFSFLFTARKCPEKRIQGIWNLNSQTPLHWTCLEVFLHRIWRKHSLKTPFLCTQAMIQLYQRNAFMLWARICFASVSSFLVKTGDYYYSLSPRFLGVDRLVCFYFTQVYLWCSVGQSLSGGFSYWWRFSAHAEVWMDFVKASYED